MINTDRRNDFPALSQKRNGKPPIYFDNACMTLKPKSVINAIMEYYTKFPACGGEGRSAHWFSSEVNKGVEEARKSIAKFIGAKSEREIIFTRNTTEGINIVANGYPWGKNEKVLTTVKEHNSNLYPWKDLEKKGIIKYYYLPFKEDHTFDLGGFEKFVKEKGITFVSMGITSNLDGYTIPFKEITDVAHRYGAKVLLDGAQYIPHNKMDVGEADVDFLSFSVHKMCGPSGIGILYGKYELLKEIKPFIKGGGMIADTFLDRDPIYLSPPHRFEAGLQDYAGIIGAGEAARYLMEIGMEDIAKYEEELNSYLDKKLKELPEYGKEFSIIGPSSPEKRSGITTLIFARSGVVYMDENPPKIGIASLLDAWENIMVRSGEFCVNAWFNFYKISREREKVRASLYFYNTKEEVDKFVEAISKIVSLPEYKILPKEE